MRLKEGQTERERERGRFALKVELDFLAAHEVNIIDIVIVIVIV